MPLEIVIALAGGGASVVVAWGGAKQKLSSIAAVILDLETRLRAIDSRLDKTEAATEMTANRLAVISHINSPEALDRKSREIAGILKDIDHMRAQWGPK